MKKHQWSIERPFAGTQPMPVVSQICDAMGLELVVEQSRAKGTPDPQTGERQITYTYAGPYLNVFPLLTPGEVRTVSSWHNHVHVEISLFKHASGDGAHCISFFTKTWAQGTIDVHKANHLIKMFIDWIGDLFEKAYPGEAVDVVFMADRDEYSLDEPLPEVLYDAVSAEGAEFYVTRAYMRGGHKRPPACLVMPNDSFDIDITCPVKDYERYQISQVRWDPETQQVTCSARALGRVTTRSTCIDRSNGVRARLTELFAAVQQDEAEQSKDETVTAA